MAIGAYDRPTESNIINTYSPIPFDVIAQAGAARQGRYDETLASLDQNQSYLDQLSAGPFPEHQQYLENARKSLERISKEYAGKDLSQSYIRRQLKDAIKKEIDPVTLARITRSKQKVDANQKPISDLDMRGLYSRSYEQTVDPALTGKLGINEEYTYTPSAFQDPEIYAGQTYFAPIVPKEDFYNNTETGEIVATEKRTKGDIDGAVEDNWRSFADTPQGQWVVNQYQQRNPEDRIDPEVIAKEYLRDLGYRKYLINNRKVTGQIPGWVGRQGSEEESDIDAVGNTQSITNRNLPGPKEIKKIVGFNPEKISNIVDVRKEIDLDGDGNLIKKTVGPEIDWNTGKEVGPGVWEEMKTSFSKEGFKAWIRDKGNTFTGKLEEEYDKAKKAGTTKAKSYKDFNLELQQKEYDIKHEEQKKIVSQWGINSRQLDKDGNYAGDLSKLSDGDLILAYSEAYNGIKSFDLNNYLYETKELSSSARSATTRQIIPDIDTREITITDTKSDINGEKVNGLEDVYKEFNVPVKEQDPDNIVLTGAVLGLGGYAASIKVGGKFRYFTVSFNIKEQAATALLTKATELSLDGRVGEKPLGDNYIVTTILERDINGRGGFTSNIRTADKTNIPGTTRNEMSLQELEMLALGSILK